MKQRFFNTRIKFYFGKDGSLLPEDALCFDKGVFNPEGVVSKRSAKDTSLRRYSSADSIFYDIINSLQHDITEYSLGDILSKSVVLSALVPPSLSNNADNRQRSISRAMNKCRDYIMSNPDLDMMITLTLSPDKVDRYDYIAVMKKVSQWLANRVRRHNLKYVIVPELHKDGAIHFHGFVNSDAVKLHKTKYKRGYDGSTFIGATDPKRKGRIIYNIADWDIGYTTAVRIGRSDTDRRKTAEYILKYITKSGEKVGGRWYLHSNNLQEPYMIYCEKDFNEFPTEALNIIPSVRLKKITAKSNLTYLGMLIHESGISTEKAIYNNTSSHATDKCVSIEGDACDGFKNR